MCNTILTFDDFYFDVSLFEFRTLNRNGLFDSNFHTIVAQALYLQAEVGF